MADELFPPAEVLSDLETNDPLSFNSQTTDLFPTAQERARSTNVNKFDLITETLPVPVIKQSEPRKLASDELIYNSYSGADITAVILLPNEPKPLVLGELQTISYSIHRENTPIRVAGRVNPIGWLRGPRTIAGSMIFTQFDSYTFLRLQQVAKQAANGVFITADALPPFDVILSFSNEYGMTSKMKIYGVNIVDEGGTFSIDDLISEQTFTYMARGIQPLTAYVPEGMDKLLGNREYVARPNTITFG